MIVKTNSLGGLALSYALARAQGFLVYKDELLGGRNMHGWWFSGLYSDPNKWEPLESIEMGGMRSIVEEEKISVIWHDGTWRATNGANVTEGANDFCPVQRLPNGSWVVEAGFGNQFGKTSAEAVRRCLVEMRLGQEVDVPDEICGNQPQETPVNQQRPRG